MTTLLERISKVASARSMTNNSHDAASASASVATYEFDLHVVRDSEQQRKRRRGRRLIPSRNVESKGNGCSSVEDRENHEAINCVREEQDSQCQLRNKSLGSSSIELQPADPSYAFQTNSTGSSSGLFSILPSRAITLSIVIAVVGILSSTLFLGFGISKTVEDEDALFAIRAHELAKRFNKTWSEYVLASLWVNQACSFNPLTRDEFRRVSHFVHSHVDVVAVQWIPKVLHEDRQQLEQTSKQYFENNYPYFEYRGITGFEPKDPTDPNSTLTLQPRSIQEFYYPVHLLEPMDAMNAVIIDLDLTTAPGRKEMLALALDAFKPTGSQHYHRLKPDGSYTEEGYIQLIHPGISLPETPDEIPQGVSGLVVPIPAVIQSSTTEFPEDVSIFIYDSTDNELEPEFVVAAEVYKVPLEESGETIVYLDEISFTELVDETVFFMHSTKISVASRTWTMVVVALEGTFEPNLTYVIFTGKFIMLTSLCIALWIATNHRRMRTILDVKRKADMEKTAIIVRSARENARAEQELNDYIAHEIRNPLAAAMSACTFVKAALSEKSPLATPESIQAIREDVEIIDSSLTFTHDLLRSMLDMHRAASKSLIIEESPLDVLSDILDPVVAMLYKRDLQFEMRTECPSNFFILSDRLRLKQILLNLCRNSARYVHKGYIKVGANIVDGQVQFYVEDSGPGISEARRKNLFSKFQESLEVMDQGSGVGLCLCKSMANMLGGDIWLDESFDSGVDGFPGSRFVISLGKGPIPEKEVKDTLAFLAEHSESDTTHEETISHGGSRSSSSKSRSGPAAEQNPGTSGAAGLDIAIKVEESGASTQPMTNPTTGPNMDATESQGKINLPESLSILFVDDDMILRKLFMRSVRKVVDNWEIQEAASGEAALKLTDQTEFDIIFMDQYMASVEKKLLGTETVRAMRSNGVRSRICGLSANDVEEGFWNAGADAFMFKPFPCKKEQLEQELNRILFAPRNPVLGTFPAKEAETSKPIMKSTTAEGV